MNPAFFESASTEAQLLACCARTHVSSEMAGRIRELASGPLDWESVLARAQDHSVLPLLAQNVRFYAAGGISADVAARLDTAIRENAVRCLAQTSELVRAVEVLASQKIRALPYKGPVIAAQAYQDITAREFEDLDIILPQRDIAAANDAIRSLGYEPRSAWLHSSNGRTVIPGEYSYFHAKRQTTLELHTERTLRHFPVEAPLEDFFARAVILDLGGSSVRTFCAEDALTVYCIHGTKDFWQKLIWIADIVEMLRTCSGLDWDSVWRTSERLRAQRMVHLGLALAAGIPGAQLPSDVQMRIQADRSATALAAEIAKRLLMFDAPTKQQTARERFLYRRKTVPGLAAGWSYALRLTIAPAEEDWAGNEVVSPGSAMHRVLRPFRLFRKHGSSGT